MTFNKVKNQRRHETRMEWLFRWETMLLKHLTCWKIKMVQWLHRKRIVPVMPKGRNWTSKCWLTKPNNTFESCMQCAFGTWKNHISWYYSTVSLRADTDKSSIKMIFLYPRIIYLHAFCPANAWSVRTHRFGPAVWHFVNVVDYVLLSKKKQQIKDPWIPLGGEGGGPEKWLFREPTTKQRLFEG